MDSEFTTIYSTANEMQAKVVCGYLQAQGVTAFMRNDLAFPYPSLQLVRPGRELEVLVPTVEAEDATAILADFSPEAYTLDDYAPEDLYIEEEAFAEDPADEAENTLHTLAVFREQEDAEICQAYLEAAGYPAILKCYSSKDRLEEPMYGMKSGAPYHLLIDRDEASYAGDALIAIDLPEYEETQGAFTGWICPVCGATSVLLSHDPLKRKLMTKLLIIWAINLPVLFLLHTLVPTSILFAWFISIPIILAFTYLFAHYRTCLHCKNTW